MCLHYTGSTVLLLLLSIIQIASVPSGTIGCNIGLKHHSIIVSVAVVSSNNHFNNVGSEWTSEKINLVTAKTPTEDVAVLLFVQNVTKN